MISHKHRCIFIEVPKTGSTSIRNLIGHPRRPHLDILQVRDELPGDLPSFTFLKNFILRVNPRKRKEQAERVFAQYFKFGFVRNPWDRTVSLYLRKEGVQMAGKMTFEEFVGWINHSSDTCLFPTPHKNQLDWFTDRDGKLLVDFIGKFENLRDDWKKVAGRLGLPPELPHLNQNPRKQKHYTDYYTPKTRDVIAQKFRVDVEYFGYTFGD